jgi:hypothetical protein
MEIRTTVGNKRVVLLRIGCWAACTSRASAPPLPASSSSACHPPLRSDRTLVLARVFHHDLRINDSPVACGHHSTDPAATLVPAPARAVDRPSRYNLCRMAAEATSSSSPGIVVAVLNVGIQAYRHRHCVTRLAFLHINSCSPGAT